MPCPLRSILKEHWLKRLVSWVSSFLRKEHYHFLDKILKTVVDPHICIGADGHVILFNQAAEELFGYKKEEVIGENVKILMPPYFAEHHDGYIRYYLETGEKKVIGKGREVEARKKNGEIFPARLAVSELYFKGKRIFVGSLIDLTAEREQKMLREEAKIKQDFLTSMSHELRTPLHVILGFIECLQEEIDGPLVPEQKDSLLRASKAGKHLLGLVNNLLMLSKVTRPSCSFREETCSLTQELEEVSELMRPLVDKKNLVLQVELPADPCIIQADQEGVRQILFNLIGNAIKMTEKGSVTAKVEKLEKRVKVSVKDTGPGIDKEDLPHIFFPFRKSFLSDSHKREQGGLGLAITKTLVESFKGKISVDSEKDKGTIFTVEFMEVP